MESTTQLDIWAALSWSCLPFILLFLYMDIFDTTGTLVGVAEEGGLMQNGRLPLSNCWTDVDKAGLKSYITAELPLRTTLFR